MPKFRILAGCHTQKDSDGVERTYEAPDVFESPKELDKQFGRNKYARMSDHEPCTKGPGVKNEHSSIAVAPPDFEKMSVKELMDYAASEEIDLGFPKGRSPSKAEVIQALKAALQPS